MFAYMLSVGIKLMFTKIAYFNKMLNTFVQQSQLANNAHANSNI